MIAMNSVGRHVRILAPLVACAAVLAQIAFTQSALAQTPVEHPQELKPKVQKFIDFMVRTHGFDARDLRTLFEQTRSNEKVLRSVSAPTTSRPWYQFRPLAIDDSQVADGVQFWNENVDLLDKTRREFGVPQSIIVALIGIESRYGRFAGGYRVIDSLYTLSFEWPKRAAYFQSELEQFLVLAREQGWDVNELQGSFAGALGWPQFMPSSYRRYAIDYSGDGNVDLWTSSADIIGSVANYLQKFGWKRGQPVAAPAQVVTASPKATTNLRRKPKISVSQWLERGVDNPTGISGSLAASLFTLEAADGLEYWFGFENFHVLLKYNFSRNYVMSVYQLAEEIRQSWEQPVR